jgi:hypothetical protein
MTRDDAIRLVKALFTACETESPGLSEQGFGGIMLPDADLYFEHQGPEGALICYGRIHEFRKDAEPALFDALQAEGKGLPPGLRVEYVPETRRLFLVRTYDDVVDEQTFVEQMAELAKTTAAWGGDVLSRAFDAARTKK